MNAARFTDFFRAATATDSNPAGNAPYGYQCRLACGERGPNEPESEWLAGGTECRSRLIDVPTGLGKTAAVVLAWLWNVLHRAQNEAAATPPGWPRRLVYCLPMRTLVEQTAGEIERWLRNLRDAVLEGRIRLVESSVRDLLWLAGTEGLSPSRTSNLPSAIEAETPKPHSPVILMGGEELDQARREWDLYPEKPAILVGTQDMLLSRALNRGYAAGRARWPKDFALLNNDCLWIFDEVQLMGSGFATGLQLQGWRETLPLRADVASLPKPSPHPVAVRSHSWWMSATAADEWFDIGVDFPSELRKSMLATARRERDRLWKEDRAKDTRLAVLLGSNDAANSKRLQATPRVPALKKEKEETYLEAVKKAVEDKLKTEPRGLVLVILNTVDRAVKLYKRLQSSTANPSPLLLHSRFRRRERRDLANRLKQLRDATDRPRLVIATQVIEAGVDISADVLFIEACPWPSFIQRLGRAARGFTWVDGKPFRQEAQVFWMDVSQCPSPYEEEEMQRARAEIDALAKRGQANLSALRLLADELAGPENITRRRELLPYEPRFVPRAKDLFELFDTTPDLTGADVDVSRFIRDGDDLDVQVFWRRGADLPQSKAPPKKLQPEADELCPVKFIHRTKFVGFRDFVKDGSSGRIWRWDYRDGWTSLSPAEADRVYPGQVFLVEDACGGYRTDTGWTGNPADQDFPIGPWSTILQAAKEPDDADPGDSESSEESDKTSEAEWQSIWEHSDDVARRLCSVLRDGGLLSTLPPETRAVLALAARLHDWGKAHRAFYAKLKPDARRFWETIRKNRDWPAKAPGADKKKQRGSSWKAAGARDTEDEMKRRAGFRHELASSLAVLELLRMTVPDHPALAWPDDAKLREAFGWSPLSSDASADLRDHPLVAELKALSREQFDLLLYLIAAHHGKVRMSLRASPDDLRDNVPDPARDKRQVRGVRDPDPLPPVKLPDLAGGEIEMPAITLHLDAMELGLSARYGRSWRERTQALLEAHGPFRLAWHEMLLRIADSRASRDAKAALDNGSKTAHGSGDELAKHRDPLAQTSGSGQNPPALEEHSRAGGTEHGVRGRTGEPADASRDTRPDRATRYVETTRGILSYGQLAPLLAEGVVLVQAEIERGHYEARPLDDDLLLELHQRIAGDLVPDWAGRWRAIEVHVGNLRPPPAYEIAGRMRDYCLDLQARWPAAAATLGDLTLELLAFAEGRFLTIHPFQDFNGRVVRLFLSELLRRLDLPPVRLEAEGDSERAAYFAALEAADTGSLRPLIEIWRQRLESSAP